VKVVTIDRRSGLLPFEGDTETLDEVFLDGTEPTTVVGSAPADPPLGADGGDAADQPE
jgi:hypothetical protein